MLRGFGGVLCDQFYFWSHAKGCSLICGSVCISKSFSTTGECCNVTQSVLWARSALLPQEQRSAAVQVHSVHSWSAPSDLSFIWKESSWCTLETKVESARLIVRVTSKAASCSKPKYLGRHTLPVRGPCSLSTPPAHAFAPKIHPVGENTALLDVSALGSMPVSPSKVSSFLTLDCVFHINWFTGSYITKHDGKE